MPRKFTLIIMSVTCVLLAAGCASKKVKPSDNGVNADGSASGDQNPVISDKEMNFDPQGSDSGKINGLGTVFFELDQSRLTDTARKQLQTNADWIKKNPGTTVQIEGHTDSRGSNEYNLSLGERRARAVKAYLTSLGIDNSRTSVISYGEEKPMASGENESAWSKNRRANFVPLQQ